MDHREVVTTAASSTPTLGIYAPPPGSRSGLKDYALSSSELIADLFDISFVSSRTYRPPEEFDYVLYHIGCGSESVAAYHAAGNRLGPVVLHEHILSQFFIENHDSLDAVTNARVRTEFQARLGVPINSSDQLDHLMRQERGREIHYLDVGLERLVAERATTLFTHSAASFAHLSRSFPQLTKPLEFPARPMSRDRRQFARRILGIPETATIVGSFGFVGTHKRLPVLLRAWAAMRVDPRRGHLLILGAGASDLKPLTGVSTTMLEYIESPEEFLDYLGVVDIGVQLRWPTLGETSGVVAQFLASDIPVIVSTDSILPFWSADEIIRVVPPGLGEETRLAAAIGGWMVDPPTGRGRRATPWLPSWRDTVLQGLGCSVGNGSRGPAVAEVGLSPRGGAER